MSGSAVDMHVSHVFFYASRGLMFPFQEIKRRIPRCVVDEQEVILVFSNRQNVVFSPEVHMSEFAFILATRFGLFGIQLTTLFSFRACNAIRSRSRRVHFKARYQAL